MALLPCRSDTARPDPEPEAVPDTAHLRLLRAHDPGRAEVERFIAEIYARRYGARLSRFAPVLACLEADGRPVAAAGLRCADTGPLFLERYLDRPVEQLLARPGGQPPARAVIAEVGSLAASQAGQGRRLMLLLGPLLAAHGVQWVTGTLTAELRNLFRRIGVAPLTLAAADPSALGDEAADWGDYYAHAPLVLAGHLPQALRHLRRYAQAVGEVQP
jgi:hypothetical protein